MNEVPTYCRICESACGLIASVEGDRVVKLSPDPAHPLSKGFACLKGTRFTEVQAHARRVLRPLWRTDGGLGPVSWSQANAKIGEKLARIIDRDGPEAVGLFSGNAAGHSLGAVLGGAIFQRAIGTTKHYACLTLDNSEMFVVTEACLGNPMRTFVADYAGADELLLIGTDPLSSQPSQAQSNPGGVFELLERARAKRLCVVDPRRSATAARADLHLQPKPGTDCFLLAGLLREVLRRTARLAADPLFDPEDLRALQRAVAPFSLERAAEVCGLELVQLERLLQRLLAARRPLVWCGLGVLLSAHGTLGYWLTLCLQAALGGLDRPGGWMSHPGALDLARWLGRLGIKGRDFSVRSRVGGYPAILGTVAAATLAEDALKPGDGQLKALIVLGGNPALSLPDAARAQAALRGLELLVSVDLFVNDTGALAHAVLPARTWLERSDVPVHMAQQRRLPHLQRAPAVVAPRGQAREDFEIMRDLALAAGRPKARWAQRALLKLSAERVARWAVGALSPLSWAALERAGRTAAIPEHGALRRSGSAVRLAVPEFVRGLSAMRAPETSSSAVRMQLLTSVRPPQTMNSWMHQGRGAPAARLHPSALAALHVQSGDRVSLVSGRASVKVTTQADAGVRPGVIVLPYGWGHLHGALGSDGGSVGANANTLVHTEQLEPFTGQPVSNGLWVEVRKILP